MNKRLNPEPTPLEEKLRYHRRLGHIVPPRKIIKTPEQIEGIRRSALINTAVLDHVAAHIHEGMSTEEIDTLVYDFTLSHGAIPAPFITRVFPKVYAPPLTTKYATAYRIRIFAYRMATSLM